ncbi:MAG: DUF2786 domain-containing protein, partial [Akkermansia sp.]
MNDREKLIEKLRKLLTLSERGEGGEAVNAKELLERMMQKHGIDAESLTDIRTLRYNVDYDDERLLLIVIVSFALQVPTDSVSCEIVQNEDYLGCDLKMSIEAHGLVYSLYEHHRIGLEKSIRQLAKNQSKQVAELDEKISALKAEVTALKAIKGNIGKNNESARKFAVSAYVNINNLVDFSGWENSQGKASDGIRQAFGSCVVID